MLKIGWAAVGLLALAPAPAQANDCPHRASRDATVDAGGARVVKVEAGAGSLRVEGRSGTSVVVHGTACATREGMLERVQLRASRDGDTVRVKTDIPENAWSFGGGAWLDLVVEVPSDVSVDVEDGSGSAEIVSVGEVHIDDGSGELKVRDVERDVRVRDGSGEIEIHGVGGSVDIEDDGSGSIDVDGVKGNVVVEEDGSGSIDVRDVGGDFTVRHDGSGSIHYQDVRGHVHVPKHR